MAESAGPSKEETSADFYKRFTPVVTHGFVSLAVSLGLQTGLFDALADLHEKESSSQEIAVAAGLKERYVREWLGAMVVARIVDINPETEKYRLPAHRVPFFKAGSSQSDLSLLTTAIPMFGDVFKKIMECMKEDGPTGLPYSDYTDFHTFMANLSGRFIENHLVQDFVPSLPKIHQQLKSGIKVLDFGCGRGNASIAFAEAFPNSTIIGSDISQICTDFASQAAKDKGLSNVTFICCDAVSFPEDWTASFDYIFVHDVIHDLPRADLVLKEAYRVLKPGGSFSVIDCDCRTKHADNINDERRSRVYTISLFHCLPVSMYFPGSLGLGTAWGREKATELLTTAGFQVDSITKPPHSNSGHYMCSKPK